MIDLAGRAGHDLYVRVDDAAADSAEIAALTRRLRDELRDIDIEAELVADAPPDGAKSVSGVVTGLGVRLGAGALRATIAKVRDWATRNGRGVEMTLDGDRLKATGLTEERQDQLIDAWLARHAPQP